MSDFFVIDDNFIPVEAINKIQEDIMLHRPYFLNPGETDDPSNDSTYVIGDNFGDFPFFASRADLKSESDSILNISYYLLDHFAKKNNLKIGQVMRARSNITLMSNEKRLNWPHVDNKDSHFVFLYYVNDSDGDTVIFNQEHDGNLYDQNYLSIYKQISPKAGTAIIFDGAKYHTNYAPHNNELRCAININIDNVEQL